MNLYSLWSLTKEGILKDDREREEEEKEIEIKVVHCVFLMSLKEGDRVHFHQEK